VLPSVSEGEDDVLINHGGLDDFEALGSPDTSDGRTLTPPGPTIIEQQPSPEQVSKRKGQEPEGDDDKVAFDAVDSALRKSIKGIYNLWTLRQSPGDNGEVGKGRFIDIVREVLDSSA
jgi:hypothetical protein